MSYLRDIASNVDQVRKHSSFLPDIVIDSDLHNALGYGKAVYGSRSKVGLGLGLHNGSPQSSQNTLSQPMSLESSPHADKLMKPYSSSQFTEVTKSTETVQVSRPTPAGRPPQFNGEMGELRSVYEIPPQYRHIFSAYPAFNVIQSRLLDTILYSDRPMVISAPTGSGKTVVFELAIVRLLMKLSDMKYTGNFKIVYMAPVKALCAERFHDWQEKFSCLGINCQEITGDSVDVDLEQLSNYNLVLTTPEKWDSLTRRWKQNKQLVQLVKLFLIDEVHLVSEEKRGPTLEAVVSRMKTVQETLEFSKHNHSSEAACPINIRFLAVSATIPNIEDVATWLGDSTEPAYHMKFGEEYRPVKLQQVVLGFHHQPGQSPFVFERNLSYRLRDILFKYSENKPTLIFCCTRKGVLQTAETLSQQITFSFNGDQKEIIACASNNLVDTKLRGFLMSGVGAHHAGMDVTDRRIMEELFRKSMLPVLVTTSTLAMGVNLPAHLVIIKSTQQYIAGIYQDYSDSQLLQMIGRAGRPQYDSSATAVIMTKSQDRARYLRLVGGSDLLESSLHRHLGEHLNSEIVLETITDKFIAMNWIRSTFLYVRAIKNPKYYGISGQLTKTAIENNLQDLVLRELNILAKEKLINMEDIMDLRPTEAGKLMANFYTSVNTMKAFNTITGNETLEQMVSVIASCHEFADVQLRRSEKKTLNLLNRAKDCESIRFPFKGVVRDNPMKVNVLLQAVLGCLTIHDHSLHQDSIKIMRMGERVSKCLARFLFRDEHFKSLLNGTILAKCFYSKLWENSIYVTRQLKRIGPVYSAQLASAGKTTFQSIIEANPRDLERILHKPPPLGNELKEAASHLPQYGLEIHLTDLQNMATITLTLMNLETISEFNTAGPYHWLTLLVGDSNNKVLVKERFKDEFLIQLGGCHDWYIDIDPLVEEVHAHLISDHWVGIDVQADAIITNAKERQTKVVMKKALEEYTLKRGLSNARTPAANKNVTQITKPKKLTIIEQIKNMEKRLPEMNIKRLKCDTLPNLTQTNLDNFLYTPVKSKKLLPWKEFVENSSTTSTIWEPSLRKNSAIGETSNVARSGTQESSDRNESDIEWIENTPPTIMSNFQKTPRTHLNYQHDASVVSKYPSLNILGNNMNKSERSLTQSCVKNTTNQSISPEDSQSSTHFSSYEDNAEANISSSAHQWEHFKVDESKATKQRNVAEMEETKATKQRSVAEMEEIMATKQRSVAEIYKICKPINDYRRKKFSEFDYYQENGEKSFPWTNETEELKDSSKCSIPPEGRVHARQETEGRAQRELPEMEARTRRQLPHTEAMTRRQLPHTEAMTRRQLPETEARAIRQLPEAKLSKKTDTDILELQYRQRIVLPNTQKSNEGVRMPVKNHLPNHYYPIFINHSEGSMPVSDAPHTETHFSKEKLGELHIKENNPNEIQLAIEKGRISDMAFGMETFSIKKDNNGSYPESKDNIQFQLPELDFDLGLDALLESQIDYESPENNCLVACTEEVTSLSKKSIATPAYLDKEINSTRKYKICKPKWDPNDPVMTLLYGLPTTTTFELNNLTEDIKDTVTYKDGTDIYKSTEDIHQQPCLFENQTQNTLHFLNENSEIFSAPSVAVLPQHQNNVLQQNPSLLHSNAVSKNKKVTCVTQHIKPTQSPKQCEYISQCSTDDEDHTTSFLWRCSQETFTQRSTINNHSQSEDSESYQDTMSPVSIKRENSNGVETLTNCNIQPRRTQQMKQHSTSLHTVQYELYNKHKLDSSVQIQYAIHQDSSPVMSPRLIKAELPMQEVSQRQTVNSFEITDIDVKPYPERAEYGYFQSSPIKYEEPNLSPDERTKHGCSVNKKICTQLSQQYGPLRQGQYHHICPSPKPKHYKMISDPYEGELNRENHANIQPKHRHCAQWAGDTLSQYRFPQNNMHPDREKMNCQDDDSTQQHTKKFLHLTHQNSIDEQIGDGPNELTPKKYIHHRLLPSTQEYSPPKSNKNKFATRLMKSGKYTMSQLVASQSPMRYCRRSSLENPDCEEHSLFHDKVVKKSPRTNYKNNSYSGQMHHLLQGKQCTKDRQTSRHTSSTDNGYLVKMPEYIKPALEYPESTTHGRYSNKYRKRQNEETSHQLDLEKKLCLEVTAKTAQLEQEINLQKQPQCAQPVRRLSTYFQQLHPVQDPIQTTPRINTARPIQPSVNRALLDQGKLFSYCKKRTPSFKQVCSLTSRKKEFI